jgi:hypothetical protein
VYSNVTPGHPRSGSLVGTKSGTLATPGYNTIPLAAVATVAANHPFSVVIQMTTPGYNYPIPVEYATTTLTTSPYFYSGAASACPGQSFLSHDGTTWSDGAAGSPTFNVCLKAFGNK